MAAAATAGAALIAYLGDDDTAAPRAHAFESDAAPAIALTARAGSCHAPDWLEANAGALTHSDLVVRRGSFSVALPVRFTGAHGEEAGVACVLSSDEPADLRGVGHVTFDVFAPTAGLHADLAFNSPWRAPSSPPRRLHRGWNTVSYDLSADSRDFPGGQAVARQLLLRLRAGRPTTYRGRAYLGGIRLVPGDDPLVQLVAPRADGDVAGRVQIRVRARARPGRRITAVRCAVGQRWWPMTFDRRSGEWRATWAVAGAGVRRIRVSARDSAGRTAWAHADVLARDSAPDVEIVSPTFDSELSGGVEVRAAIGGGAEAIRLRAGRLSLRPARLGPVQPGGWRTAAFRLDTRELADGVHALRVTARDEHGRAADETDVIVRNGRARWSIVSARGTRFEAAGRPFRFVGANQYDFFTRADEWTSHVQETATGRVIPKGTRIGWREQVDRLMLDAVRRGITVLRTWAFGDGPGRASFQPVLGEYREATFRRLDYVLDSARRHRIRLILTLTNYPPDYGGVGFYASELGLPHRNDFFRSARARRHYQRYVARVVRRVNTLNGVPYRRDPAIFAWELVNEPRMECHEDGRRAWGCDPSGSVLRRWIARSSAYVKRLDPRHMVVAGVEGHGRVETPSGPLQWSGRFEGNGNDPWLVQDVPGTDFLTIHVYPNEVGYDYEPREARRLLAAVVRSGTARGKPVVMSEFGIRRTLPVRDRDGATVVPGSARYERVRRGWYRMMFAACYRNGCAGSNVWMISDRPDPDLNINLSTPAEDARRDAPLVALLERWSRRLRQEGALR